MGISKPPLLSSGPISGTTPAALGTFNVEPNVQNLNFETQLLPEGGPAQAQTNQEESKNAQKIEEKKEMVPKAQDSSNHQSAQPLVPESGQSDGPVDMEYEDGGADGE